MSEPVFRAGIVLAFAAQLFFTKEDDCLKICTAVQSLESQTRFFDSEGVSLPLRYFHDATGKIDEELLERFCRRLATDLIPRQVEEALYRDFAFHVHHSTPLLAIGMQISDETYEQVFARLSKYHTDLIMARLRQMVGYSPSGSGRQARWNSLILAETIKSVMRDLSPPLRTYAGVQKKLKKNWPDRAPKSAAALKKMVSRYGLDWAKLKKEAETSSTPPLYPASPPTTVFSRAARGDQ